MILTVRLILMDHYKLDALLTPTTPTTAFEIGKLYGDSVLMQYADQLTVAANHAGTPAISIPAGLDSAGLPIGIQFLGADYQEAKLLQIARAYEHGYGRGTLAEGKTQGTGVNRSRIAILFVLFATISAACLIPREMAGYILPPTASITPTESLTPPPSLTPFLPLTMTPPPAITPSTTTEISPSPSVSPITTLTGYNHCYPRQNLNLYFARCHAVIHIQ